MAARSSPSWDSSGAESELELTPTDQQHDEVTVRGDVSQLLARDAEGDVGPEEATVRGDISEYAELVERARNSADAPDSPGQAPAFRAELDRIGRVVGVGSTAQRSAEAPRRAVSLREMIAVAVLCYVLGVLTTLTAVMLLW